VKDDHRTEVEALLRNFGSLRAEVRRCNLKPVLKPVLNPVLKAPWFQRLTLNCDQPLSKFAFNFNLGRYPCGKRLVSMLETKM